MCRDMGRTVHWFWPLNFWVGFLWGAQGLATSGSREVLQVGVMESALFAMQAQEGK